MKSIVRLALTFAFASVLAAPAFSQSPVAGKFTLPHDVRWQNTTVPAGDYKFELESKGASQMLTLHKFDSPRNGFMFMVQNVQVGKTSGSDRILLVSESGRSFVRSMELGDFDLTLNFAAPPQSAGKEIAQAIQ